MLVDFEYGQGTVRAELPENTDIYIPGTTVPDPSHIPEGEIRAQTLSAIRHPIGMPPLSRLARPGCKCVIVFPDRVKGGEQPTSHRKTAIPLVIEELLAIGVRQKDILLICSNGLHRKNTEKEIRAILGDQLVDVFGYGRQILNHDSEDEAHLVDLGQTLRGDSVRMNRYVYEADVAILIGHVQGNPYGGYSGGYKHCATGITHWKSIASHHVPQVMHQKDFTPVSGTSLMRLKFDEIGQHMEKCMGKKFFCCDAVTDTYSRQIAIFSGWAKEMQPRSWQVADRRTYVHWAQKKYDVLIFGLPQSFHYGDGMGTNPIMLMQAISAQIIRHKRVLNERCVVICSALCNGHFHEELWPYTVRMYEMWQRDDMQTLPDMNRLGEYFATDAEYIRQYRYANAFHPFHGFSMISCAHIAEMHASAIYITGAEQPGYARGMGLKTRHTIEEALQDAQRKYIGPHPNILALPLAFKTAAVHLCMQKEGDHDLLSAH